MKKLGLLAISLSLTFFSFAEVVVLQGVYQGKDLYIKNPFAPDGVGFCVFEVLVNGEVTSDEVNSSAFAVDLTLHDLEIGDPIEIVLRSKSDCSPRVINPEAIIPKSTFEVSEMSVKDENSLVWTTSSEAGALPFVIEQFKWNKWVKLGEVMGEGDEGPNTYQFSVKLDSGDNQFRIKQNDADGTRYSERISVQSNSAAVALMHTKVFESIDFDRETHYELFDEYGSLVAQGYGQKIDTSELAKGQYYLNYGAIFGSVINKK